MNPSRISLINLLHILVFLGLVIIVVSVNAQVPQKKTSLRDSLAIIESLVNANRFKDNKLAQKYAKEEIRITRQLDDPKLLIRALFMMGKSFPASEKDSSFFYYNLALSLGDSLHFFQVKPEILYNLAHLYLMAFDYKTSIVMLDSTIHVAEREKSFSTLADAYNLMGSINVDMQDLTSARNMFEKSFEISRQHQLFRQMGNALSNLAKNEENLKKSVSMQKQAIQYLLKTSGTEEEIARIYNNIGNRLSNPDSAIFYYRLALSLGLKGGLDEVKMGAYNNMAYSFLDKKEPGEAEFFIKKAIIIGVRHNDQDWLSTLYDSYADILTAKGDIPEALKMQKKALESRIESDNNQASTQVRLLSVLLDTKNKELLIQSKEKEILLQRSRLQHLQLWLAISALVIFGFIFLVLWLQQRSRAKLQNEQIRSARRIIEMEESEKGKIARELHDITGQLVLGITGEIESIEFPDDGSKVQLQGKIKDLGQSIRLISHRMNRAMMEHFSFEELIEGQCRDVQKLTGIPIHFTLPSEPMTLQEEVILHIYRIVQELLTNASKYVKGHQVWIRIAREDNGFILSYEDDGPGFETDKIKKSGMGLSNIFERAKLLGGRAVVESRPGTGTTWKISIPFITKVKIN